MKRILAITIGLAAGAASAFANLDTGLIALVPSASTIVAGIDVQKCRSSEFGQYLLAKTQADDAHFEQFMNQTGFDPRRDLQSLVITTSGSPGEGHNSSFAILARGNFDEAKIRSLAVGKGAVAESFHGVNLLVHQDHGQALAFAFPDTGIAVMGDLASIRQVVTNLGSPSSLDVELTNRIDTVSAANDAWFASSTGGAALGKQLAAHGGGQMDSQAQALQSIRAATGGVLLGPQVTVTFDAATRSAQDATSLADVFRFMASMVQMNRQSDPRAGIMAASLDNMRLNTSGDSVHLGFTMSEKNLEQIAAMGAAARKR